MLVDSTKVGQPKGTDLKEALMKTVQLAGLLMLLGVVSTFQAAALPQTSQVTAAPVKLLARDGETGDQLGQSVAVFQGIAVIGAPGDDDNGLSSGSAYSFLRDGDDWDEEDKLLAGDGVALEEFGSSVSLSDDTAMIGAILGFDNGDRTGSAYAFVQDRNDWDEQDELVPGDGVSLDQFGHSVAVDGDTAMVGAILGNDNHDQTGAAYAFERRGTRWYEKDKLYPNDGNGGDLFGYAVALSGDTAVIGARLDDDLGTNSGATYVFDRNGSRWSQQDKLLARDGAASDAFGSSVSISGNTSVIGAPSLLGASGPPGAAYVFVRDGDDWTQHTKLVAEDGESGDAFGTSVSISGDFIVVGAPQSDGAASHSGSAHLFVRSNDDWIEREQLLPQPGAKDLLFGHSVSISGNTVLVGAPGADDNGVDSGAAFLFQVDHTFTLTVTKSGTGSGSGSSSPPGIDCEPDCTEDYTVATEVTLTPTPDVDSVFVGWSGDADCADGYVTMIADLTCTAQFDLRTHVLTIVKAGSGSGTVTSIPPGIDCGVDCSEIHDINTVVSLVPTPDPGSVFGGWSGDPDCADGVVTLDTDKSCTATFDLGLYLLSVTKTGSGDGTVTSSPPGINCGQDCAEPYVFNTVVTLTPTPEGVSMFRGWSGDPDCKDGQVTMTSAKACTALFASADLFSDGFESGDTSAWSDAVP